MPAVSRAQRGLMGAALAMKQGHAPKKGKAGRLSKTMSVKSLRDYAAVSEKHLPEHK